MSAIFSAENKLIDVDTEGLVRRLLLFDHYVLNSVRLSEFPILAQKLGYEGLRDLLSSNLITIRCECLQLVEIGQTGLLGDPILPLMNYKFNWIDTHDMNQYVHDCLQNMHDVPGLKHKDAVRLKGKIAHAISPLSKETKLELGSNFSSDFTNSQLVKASVDLVLQRKYGKVGVPYEIAIHACEGDGLFRAETNLGKLTNLGDRDVHQIVQAGLLGISSTSQVVGEMKAYNALSGFRQDELPLFWKKLDFLANHSSSDAREKQFGKVLELSEIPSFHSDDSIFNVDRLLKVRESSETSEFRDWLINGGGGSEKEIRERVAGFRAQAGLKLASGIGKTMRFLVTTLAGMIPTNEAPIISTGLGIVDTFILEKIFPRSGIAAFVNELYPSIFEDSNKLERKQ